MSQPLFIDPSLRMEKVAYDVRLDEEPEEWPVVVVRESHKQLPFLKDYETEVEFDKLDTARGFAVGKMLVWPTQMTKSAAAENHQLVSVPVIIRGREMAPLDVYSHRGSMKPMDQDKVAQVLFRPQMFSGSVPKGTTLGTSLMGQITPPNTDHQYNAGSLHKHGSAKFGFRPLRKRASAGLWREAVPTFRSEDVNAFGEKLAADHGLRQSYASTPVLRAALSEMLEAVQTEKTASGLRDERLSHLRPTVVQVVAEGNGFLCKTANRHCFHPTVSQLNRFEAQELLPPDAFSGLLREGHVTWTSDPVMSSGSSSEKVASEAEQVGVYRVWRAGRPVEGVVVPRVVDFDGRPLDLQVFAGDEDHSVQEKVAGSKLRDIHIHSDPPMGTGVFVYQEGPQALATEPVYIQTKVKVAHEVGSSSQLLCTRLSTGETIKVTVVPGLQKIAKIGDEVALPESFRFLSLRGKQSAVSSTPEDANIFEHRKTAGYEAVELLSDGHTYALRGPHARVFPEQDMLQHEAEFALCSLGLTGAQAREATKTAASRGSVRVPKTWAVVTDGAASMKALEKAASVVRLRPESLRADLTKEVALLTSPKAESLWKQASVTLGKESVDSILALNFVTPENASIYVGYIPELEKVASKLAELLVASRLGMDDVRESAAKNAMTQVNAVVRGLEGLRERIH